MDHGERHIDVTADPSSGGRYRQAVMPSLLALAAVAVIGAAVPASLSVGSWCAFGVA
jgi:hypothetical protein